LVFSMNEAGYIEVAELSDYPAADVDEAIKYCPEDCICWEGNL
jgi:ferredoxin